MANLASSSTNCFYFRTYNDNDSDVFNLVEHQSSDLFDKLIGYTQVRLGETLSTYRLLINTVRYLYLYDPPSKQMDWTLDKKLYFQADLIQGNMLALSFREAKTAEIIKTALWFYTAEERDEYYSSLINQA